MKGLRAFAVSFVASALILGIIAVFVTGSVEDILLGVFDRKSNELSNILSNSAAGDTGTGAESEEADNPLKNIEGESFSLLMVMTDYRPDVYDDYMPSVSQLAQMAKEETKPGLLENGFRLNGASNICLVTCSKSTGEFVFSAIPSDMNVYTGVGYETLHDVYGIFGVDFFLEKIRAITGIEVDYYAVMNCSEVGNLVNIIGSVNCTVPCEILTDGSRYIGSALADFEEAKNPDVKFEQFLEPMTDNIGPSSMGLLLFRDYTDGIEDEMIITEGYGKGIVRNFAKVSPDRMASFWGRCEKLMDKTNITSEFFASRGALIGAFTDDIALSITYPGTFKLSEDIEKSYFEPSIDKAMEAFDKYR